MPPRPTPLSRELLAIAASFRDIIKSLERVATVLPASEPVVPGASGARQRSRGLQRPAGTVQRRKLTLTPARRRALQVQGLYMGLLRGLKPSARARAKSIAKSQGVAAALAFVRKTRKR